AEEDDPVGVAAEAFRIGADPAHRRGAVFEEAGIRRVRVEPVVGDEGDKALGGEGAAGEAIIVLAPALPRAAVEEDRHRAAGFFFARGIDVEPAARAFGEALVLRHQPRDAILRHQRVEEGERREEDPGHRKALAARRWKRNASPPPAYS